MNKMRRYAGFSLVELVIVVVIIGMIAAIAVPRISRGAKGAAESSVRGNVSSLRNAIDMYAAEHNGKFPGADGLETTMINQLTKRTDAAGTVGTTDGVHVYGPYLRGGLPALPVGPNAGASGVELADTGPAVDESKTTKGWVYNYKTGELKANTNDLDEAGTAYDTY